MEDLLTPLRPGWLDVPAPVRALVIDRIGARVLGWKSLPGGLVEGGYELQLQAGGANYHVRMSDGHNPHAYRALRAEMENTLALPPGSPAQPPVWVIDEELGRYGPWLALGYVMQPVRTPRTPWSHDDVGEALELARDIGDVVVPATRCSGGVLPVWQDVFDVHAWSRVTRDNPATLGGFGHWLPARADTLDELAAEAAGQVSGERLGHHLLRSEAVMLAARRGAIPPMATNWVMCSVGPAFASTLSLLGFVHAQGGPSPEEALAIRPLPASYDDDELTAYLAVLAGHHLHASLRSADPALPLTRAAQREYARVLVDWLRRRLGW